MFKNMCHNLSTLSLFVIVVMQIGWRRGGGKGGYVSYHTVPYLLYDHTYRCLLLAWGALYKSCLLGH